MPGRGHSLLTRPTRVEVWLPDEDSNLEPTG
jgi:hypothetical protein